MMCGCNKNKNLQKKLPTPMPRRELAKRLEDLKSKISKNTETKK